MKRLAGQISPANNDNELANGKHIICGRYRSFDRASSRSDTYPQ